MVSSNSGRSSPGRQGASARLDLWLEQILADKRLPRNAIRVALALRKFLSTKTLKAWPAVKTLANLAGVTERTVQRLIRAMKAAGHLLIEDWAGPRGCNVYSASLFPESEVAIAPTEPAPTRAAERGNAPARPAPVPAGFDRDRVRVETKSPLWRYLDRLYRMETNRLGPPTINFGWCFPRDMVARAEAMLAGTG